MVRHSKILRCKNNHLSVTKQLWWHNYKSKIFPKPQKYCNFNYTTRTTPWAVSQQPPQTLQNGSFENMKHLNENNNLNMENSCHLNGNNDTNNNVNDNHNDNDIKKKQIIIPNCNDNKEFRHLNPMHFSQTVESISNLLTDHLNTGIKAREPNTFPYKFVHTDCIEEVKEYLYVSKEFLEPLPESGYIDQTKLFCDFFLFFFLCVCVSVFFCCVLFLFLFFSFFFSFVRTIANKKKTKKQKTKKCERKGKYPKNAHTHTQNSLTATFPKTLDDNNDNSNTYNQHSKYANENRNGHSYNGNHSIVNGSDNNHPNLHHRQHNNNNNNNNNNNGNNHPHHHQHNNQHNNTHKHHSSDSHAMAAEELLKKYLKYSKITSNEDFGGYMAWIATGSIPYGALANYIASFLDRVPYMYLGAPAETSIEHCVTKWFANMVGMDQFETINNERSGGILTSGGTMANFHAILAVRNAYMKHPSDILKFTIYGNEQMHHSLHTSANACGIPKDNLKSIPCDAS